MTLKVKIINKKDKKGRSIRIRIETVVLCLISRLNLYKKGRSIRIRIETYFHNLMQNANNLIKKEDPLE